MQLDGSTVSWAIPKGLLGMSDTRPGGHTYAIGISKRGESSRLAVETTLHPISYTVFEGLYFDPGIALILTTGGDGRSETRFHGLNQRRLTV